MCIYEHEYVCHVLVLMFVFKCACVCLACMYACMGLCIHVCACQGQGAGVARSEKALDVVFPHTVSTR